MKTALSLCSLALLLIVPAFASAHGADGHAAKHVFTKHFDKSLFDITANAAYSIEVLLDDSEYSVGKDSVGIVVHDSRDGDVKGAVLTITLKNRKTGEDAAGAISVKDRQNGLYVVSGLDLAKEGSWELAVTVRKDGLAGGVKFLLPEALKQRVPKGRYSP